LGSGNRGQAKKLDKAVFNLRRVIWQNTSVQMKWIAEKLEMKSASNVSQQLRPTAIQTRTRTLPKALGRRANQS
jgi:hypothetical protein